MTERMTDAFSMVDIADDPADAEAVAPLAAASTVLSIPLAALFPTSEIALMTDEVASSISSTKSRPLPIPSARSSENT